MNDIVQTTSREDFLEDDTKTVKTVKVELISLDEARALAGDAREERFFLSRAIRDGLVGTVRVGKRLGIVKADVLRLVRWNTESMELSDEEKSLPERVGAPPKSSLIVLLVVACSLFISALSFAEEPYSSEIHDSFQNLVPDSPPPGATQVFSKWVVGLYGVLEADGVYDSTRSFSNWPYNAGAASKQTVSGSPAAVADISGGQGGLDVNGSRLGIMISSPLYQGYRVRGLLEMDFLATTGTPPPSSASWDNPTPHLRQAWMDVETPEGGDLLAGKYWSLFGWQPYNLYSSVQIQAGPAEAYGLFPQARWYLIGHLEGTLLEPAVSIESEEPAFGLPSAVEGLKWAIPGWPGEAMIGATGKGILPLSVGVSAIETPLSGWMVRGTGTSASTSGFNEVATAYAVDAFLPI